MSAVLPALKSVDSVQNPHDLDCAIAQQWEEAGDTEQALTVANGVLDENPDNAWALLIAGRICIKMSRYGMAYNLLKRALDISGRYDARTNLSAACIGMRKLEEAKRLLQECRRLKPSDERALALLCLLAVYDCNPRLAIDLGRKALAIKPDLWDVHESVGYAHLMVGEYAEGFAGYERFIGKTKYRPIDPPSKDCPYWNGEEGQRLCVRGEQGLGDEMHFASILPEMVDRHEEIVFDAHEKLAGLFARSFPGIKVYPTRMSKPSEKDWRSFHKFDHHCLIGSLALHRRKKAEDFPGTPFLVADPERRTQWRALLNELPGKKVGIAWTGGTKNSFRNRRSLSLEQMLPVLRVPGVSWVSLQYQDPTEEIQEFHGEHGIEIKHWKRAAESTDYDDTAALVAELDLVISVCTAIVHLAGGLGKECWVLVPNKARWFYGMEGERLPWYKSVELFRQGEEWPLHTVARRLADYAA